MLLSTNWCTTVTLDSRTPTESIITTYWTINGWFIIIAILAPLKFWIILCQCFFFFSFLYAARRVHHTVWYATRNYFSLLLNRRRYKTIDIRNHLIYSIIYCTVALNSWMNILCLQHIPSRQKYFIQYI